MTSLPASLVALFALLPATAALVDVAHGFVLALFILSALLLGLVVLMQEGKGGGLSGAFGGGAAETFGVKAGTVNSFTAWLAAAFLGLALLYAGMASCTRRVPDPASRTDIEQFTGAPGMEATDGGTDTPAAGDAGDTGDAPTTPPDTPPDAPDTPSTPESPESPESPDTPETPDEPLPPADLPGDAR